MLWGNMTSGLAASPLVKCGYHKARFTEQGGSFASNYPILSRQRNAATPLVYAILLCIHTGCIIYRPIFNTSRIALDTLYVKHSTVMTR